MYAKKALYLLIIRQQFAELCERLCSITVPSTMPDILNYLLSRPVEKLQLTYFWYDIIVNVRLGFQPDTPQENLCYELYPLFFFGLDHTVFRLIPVLSVKVLGREGRLMPHRRHKVTYPLDKYKADMQGLCLKGLWDVKVKE